MGEGGKCNKLLREERLKIGLTIWYKPFKFRKVTTLNFYAKENRCLIA